ncbi:hypothetical protein SAMN05428961_11324 [Paenibacillus sp. OK060]|uniref:hypothetical protein n=1 Tax=Paenibacillus sp. OK060 TaxID=1881034 RepID=UPI00088B77E0|nr:hypothetical protein [Paenibacillus sp. OK060]SDM29962.1 hypothetical protein SAMN05428961_11324 [Paenibacillus sp. OK060]
MRKLSWIIGLTLLSTILVTGCTQDNTSNEIETQTPNESSQTAEKEQVNEEVIKVAETYKTKEYTINDVPENPEEIFVERNKELIPFFAENLEEKPVNASNIALALRAAITQQASLKPENMKFTVYQELEDYVDLDYTMDLVLKKQDGKNETVPLEGRLTLINKNGEWLIQADDFDKAAFAKLTQEK